MSRTMLYRTHPHVSWHQKRVGISIIQIGARSFISGIILCSVGNYNPGCLVGYRNPVSRVDWIEIVSSSHVRALGVAFCSGLTGINFLYTSSDSSGWVGNSKGPGIARGPLSIPKRIDGSCLLVGLDRF
jgi:hypothetical protein